MSRLRNGLLSQPAELTPLATSTITALGTNWSASARHDRDGNLYRYQSLLQRGAATEPYYDVYFRRD